MKQPLKFIKSMWSGGFLPALVVFLFLGLFYYLNFSVFPAINDDDQGFYFLDQYHAAEFFPGFQELKALIFKAGEILFPPIG